MAEDHLPLSSPTPLIPFLTDDVSMLCIARVPAASHTALSHVSRSWRSFVRSPSFFSVRSELAVTEPVLTVSISSRNNDNRSRWYHLRPHQPPSPLPLTLEEQEHVSPLPPTLEQQEHVDDDDDEENCSTAASLGPRIFLVNGNSSFQIYDARLGRWSHGPPIPRPISYAVATVAGGRLHVISCGTNLLDPPSIESLDITGSRWDPLPPIPIPAHMFSKRSWSEAGSGYWRVGPRFLVVSRPGGCRGWGPLCISRRHGEGCRTRP